MQAESHSAGASKTWARLSQEPKISAYGFDINDQIVFPVKPNASKTELVSAKKGITLYNTYSTALMLCKRGSANDKRMADLMDRSINPAKVKPDLFGNKTFHPLEKY